MPDTSSKLTDFVAPDFIFAWQSNSKEPSHQKQKHHMYCCLGFHVMVTLIYAYSEQEKNLTLKSDAIHKNNIRTYQQIPKEFSFLFFDFWTIPRCARLSPGGVWKTTQCQGSNLGWMFTREAPYLLYYLAMFFLLSYSIRDQTQALSYAKQVLYCWVTPCPEIFPCVRWFTSHQLWAWLMNSSWSWLLEWRRKASITPIPQERYHFLLPQ